MMSIGLIAVFILTLLSNSINGEQDKHHQATIRARFAGARSIEDALRIIKNSDKESDAGTDDTSEFSHPRVFAMTNGNTDELEDEKESIIRQAKGLNPDSLPTIEPRNGLCQPRVICEEVPVDRESNDTILSFPQCLEVHRCGGCCQEPQFPCVPTEQVAVTFSPLLLISLTDTVDYEVNHPLTIMNHTKCECKCNLTEDQCRDDDKVLDPILCQCFQPHCSPDCVGFSKCSVVPGYETPRCTCYRHIRGQSSNFCPEPNERPDEMCRYCETVDY